MLETLLEILKESNALAWEVTNLKKKSWEFYFIRHNLDQNRYVETEEYIVKVFVGDTNTMGSASEVFYPKTGKEELQKGIEQLLTRASYVQFPYYDLNHPSNIETPEGKEPNLEEISKQYISLLQGIQESESEDINSYELFVNGITRHYLNSNGVDVIDVYPQSMAEVIINARKENHEIELYRNYVSGTCHKEMVEEDLLKTMKMGRDRVIAQDTPKMEPIPVLLSTQDALAVYTYFIMQTNTAYIYQKVSQVEKGKVVVEGKGGDPLTIKVVKELENSSRNFSYDSEGAPIHDLTLINHDVVEHLTGSRQYSYYLKEDTFNGQNYVVEGGSKTEEELRQGRYIEIVEFSSFQVDPSTGDMFGEIRLGYLHENGETKIVTGGSISGTMREFVKTLQFSKEQKQYNNFLIPSVTRLENVSVTGI